MKWQSICKVMQVFKKTFIEVMLPKTTSFWFSLRMTKTHFYIIASFTTDSLM